MLGVFKTDGWIIKDENKTYKLKPDNLLSIDLMYDNGNFYYDKALKFKNLKIDKNFKFFNNKIYRCYYNENLKLWDKFELREDKTVSNNKYIVKQIVNYFENKWSIQDVVHIMNHNQYYQVNNRNFFRDKNKHFLNNILKTHCFKKTVFDIGCGFASG